MPKELKIKLLDEHLEVNAKCNKLHKIIVNQEKTICYIKI